MSDDNEDDRNRTGVSDEDAAGATMVTNIVMQLLPQVCQHPGQAVLGLEMALANFMALRGPDPDDDNKALIRSPEERERFISEATDNIKKMSEHVASKMKKHNAGLCNCGNDDDDDDCPHTIH